MSVKIQTAQGALLGLALGDALGTTLEFKTKDSYQHITNIVGGGPFDLKPGQWTDDTSMMLCLAQSLLSTGYNDLDDQMERYVDWYQNGTNSCTGHCFDIGNTVRNALASYMKDGKALAGSEDEYSAGNGSLMRVAPIALAYHDCHFGIVSTVSNLSTSTTHAEKRCRNACELMNYFLHTLLNREQPITKQELLTLPQAFIDNVGNQWHDSIRSIALGSYKDKCRDQIRGTGFVVDSLEAALWCFYQSDNFKDGALLAANLGDDADTTAAIYGQIAGAFYGVNELPKEWIDILAWKDDIAQLAFDLVSMPTNESIRDFLLQNIDLLRLRIIDNVKTESDIHISSLSLFYKQASTLISSAYEQNIVISGFDWLSWSNDHFNYGGEYDFQFWLSKADRVECVKYLNMCIRQDRFSDGYLQKQLQTGAIPLVLNRLMCESRQEDILHQLDEDDLF